MPELDDSIEFTVLPGDEFLAMFESEHEQGQAVAIEGPTGSGKSVLGFQLAEAIGNHTTPSGAPSRVTILGVKPVDKTLSDFHKRTKWPYIKNWPPSYGEERNIVWPRSRSWGAGKQAQMQSKIFESLLDEIYIEGGQTVVVDEEAYFERPLPKGLGLGPTMENFWSNARSNDITTIALTQRPRHVTLLMWSESQWLIIFKPEHQEDLEHIAKASGRRWEVMAIASQLGSHEFLCVRRTRDGEHKLYVSKVNIAKEKDSEASGKTRRRIGFRNARRNQGTSRVPTELRNEGKQGTRDKYDPARRYRQRGS